MFDFLRKKKPLERSYASGLMQTDLDHLFRTVERLRAIVSRIETEWGDTKDQLRRSVQRLEKANTRAEARGEDPVLEFPLATIPDLSTSYGRKVAQIEEQIGHAIHERGDVQRG